VAARLPSRPALQLYSSGPIRATRTTSYSEVSAQIQTPTPPCFASQGRLLQTAFTAYSPCPGGEPPPPKAAVHSDDEGRRRRHHGHTWPSRRDNLHNPNIMTNSQQEWIAPIGPPGMGTFLVPQVMKRDSEFRCVSVSFQSLRGIKDFEGFCLINDQ
jgi:hypothetical protein